MKTCNKCGQSKILEFFSKCKSNRDGLQRHCKQCQAKYREENIDKILACARVYRTDNKEKVKAAREAYVEKNKEWYQEYQREYRSKNREKWLEYHRQRAKDNPEYFRQKNRKRDAIKRSATVGEVDYAKVLERDGTICYLCGRDVEFRQVANVYQDNEIHFEHVIPLANGGTHSMDNIKVSCAKCNLKKSYVREKK